MAPWGRCEECGGRLWPDGFARIASVPITLTIAGSDSSGGAGIQADLKTFAAHRCYGASAVTALTAQNTLGVRSVWSPPAAAVAAQIAAVIDDLDVDAAKTGMLVDKDTIEATAGALRQGWQRRRFPLVIDPVMISKSGHALLADDAVGALVNLLLPMAAVITPNLPEAARLVGFDVISVDDAVRAGRALVARGAGAAVVKGGHGSGDTVVDVIVAAVGDVVFVESPRLQTRHTHGTGCTLSAAIAARLAHGDALADAVRAAVAYVHEGIRRAPGIGGGHGPLEHLHPFDVESARGS